MVVTGGSRGIGAAVCRAAAAAQYDIVLNYAASAAVADDLADELRELGSRVLPAQADVGVEADVVRLFDTVDRWFPALAAGPTTLRAPVASVPLA